MAGYFTKIEVADPRLVFQSIWENLPPSEKALLAEREFSSQEWTPPDRRRFRIESESFRSEVSVANVGGLRATRIFSNSAKDTTDRLPGVDSFVIGLNDRGGSQLILPGSHEPAISNATTGVIYGVEPRTRAIGSYLHSRLLLRLPARLLRRKLEELLDGQRVESVEFQPTFDQVHGAAATIRRMFDFLFAELEHSDSLLTNEIAVRSFEDNLVLSLLVGLPHNYTERLGQQKAAAAPSNVKRAEAFMRANAGTPLTIAEIAEAAGCSVRALQIAFHRFRGATPMQVLQQARLEQARTELLRAGQRQSLARIAAEHGFSSPTRFAQSFRRKYGVYPSEMLRERPTLSSGSATSFVSGALAPSGLRAYRRFPTKCVFRFPGSLFVAHRRSRRVSCRRAMVARIEHPLASSGHLQGHAARVHTTAAMKERQSR